jgi:hypothetical protein
MRRVLLASTLALLLAVFALVGIPSLSVPPVLAQGCPEIVLAAQLNNLAFSSLNSTRTLAQSFTVSGNSRVTSVSVSINDGNTNTADPLTISLRDSLTNSSASVLTSATRIDSNPAQHEATFALEARLNAGSVYYLQFRGEGAVSDGYRAYLGTGDPYPGGSLFVSSDDGVTWNTAAAAVDAYFVVRGIPDTCAPTATPTQTSTATVSQTATSTVTQTQTSTQTATQTPNVTQTPTITLTPTITNTRTITPTVFAQVTSQQATCTQVDYGSGTSPWTNPEGAAPNDGLLFAQNSFNGLASEYLECRNLGLDLPPGATLQGVEVLLSRRATADNRARDAPVRLVRGTEQSPSERGGFTIPMGPAFSEQGYGGVNDQWSFASLSVADVESPDFRVLYAVRRTSTSPVVVDVESVRVRVYYSP